jgi:hypothetical protein
VPFTFVFQRGQEQVCGGGGLNFNPTTTLQRRRLRLLLPKTDGELSSCTIYIPHPRRAKPVTPSPRKGRQFRTYLTEEIRGYVMRLWSTETLISEETLLFAKYLRGEIAGWLPRSEIP